MKKFFAILLVAAMLVLTLASCGGKTMNYMKEDLTKYVTVGEHKNLTITLPKLDEVTDEDVEEQIASEITDYATTVEVTDRGAENGDTVSIDFVGKIDGVAFEGGTAEDQEFILGEGGFIDGFEDGIVGIKTGETKTINVTFPKDYGKEELNGKAATFDITVNSISVSEPATLTDEIAKELGYEDVADYRTEVKKGLEENRADKLATNKNLYAWSTVVNGATVISYPESAVKKMANDLYDYYDAMYYQYQQYGITLDVMGITKESCRTQAEDMIKQEMVLYSIVKAGGYTYTAEEFDAKVAVLAEENKMTAEAYEKAVSKQSIETKIYYEKVLADILSTATFVEAE